MRNKHPKFLIPGALALAAVALTGCLSGGSNPVNAPSAKAKYATVVLQAKAGTVNKLNKPGLSKSSVIVLDKLTITAISNASTPDTVVVVLAVGDSGFKDTSTVDQSISVPLTLRALRNWTITAVTTDVNDSVIHSGSVNVNSLLAGEVRMATLNASPLFAMYKARFNFPDSISSATGNFQQKLNVTRVELRIDNAIVDSLLGSPIAHSTDTTLSYDYVPTGSATLVKLRVYGNLAGASAPWGSGNNLLYSRDTTVSTLSSTSLNTVALNWQGPEGGSADLTVQIGKVGLFDLDVVTPGPVLPKR